jgi:hypothetical protein
LEAGELTRIQQRKMRSLSKKLDVMEGSRNTTLNGTLLSADRKKTPRETSVDKFNPSSDFLDKEVNKPKGLSIKVRQETAAYTILDKSTEESTSH